MNYSGGRAVCTCRLPIRPTNRHPKLDVPLILIVGPVANLDFRCLGQLISTGRQPFHHRLTSKLQMFLGGILAPSSFKYCICRRRHSNFLETSPFFRLQRSIVSFSHSKPRFLLQQYRDGKIITIVLNIIHNAIGGFIVPCQTMQDILIGPGGTEKNLLPVESVHRGFL